mmetsp:Transcript_17597/g.38451  ORF Transcript_17597/g.38451 Transcript_17597/m.38451 type:complete len:281 (+) Transcript_17597:82-924(+)
MKLLVCCDLFIVRCCPPQICFRRLPQRLLLPQQRRFLSGASHCAYTSSSPQVRRHYIPPHIRSLSLSSPMIHSPSLSSPDDSFIVIDALNDALAIVVAIASAKLHHFCSQNKSAFSYCGICKTPPLLLSKKIRDCKDGIYSLLWRLQNHAATDFDCATEWVFAALFGFLLERPGDDTSRDASGTLSSMLPLSNGLLAILFHACCTWAVVDSSRIVGGRLCLVFDLFLAAAVTTTMSLRLRQLRLPLLPWPGNFPGVLPETPSLLQRSADRYRWHCCCCWF